ncbi:MAG: hypothetical protein ACYTXY_40735, partial [Nostoc sp.]
MVLDEDVAQWYSNSKKLKPVIYLYLGLFYLPKRYLTERFLSLAQAIDSKTKSFFQRVVAEILICFN